MNKSVQKVTIFLGLAAAAAILVSAFYVKYAWANRDTNATRREARKAAQKTLRQAKSAEVLPFLEKLYSEKTRHYWFEQPENEATPWRFWTLRSGDLPAVTHDYTAQLAEDSIIRFAGDGQSKPADTEMLKKLLAFTDKLLAGNTLSAGAVDSLRERRLDGCFLAKEYGRAIAALEKGEIKSRSAGWCKGTASKLRYHQSLDAGDKKSAAQHLKGFIDFMLSDEQKDFEDCDPTTGILYSRDWVVARNFLRCSKLAREAGDVKSADAFLADAKKYYATALTRAKDDESSLKTLQEELKTEKFEDVIAAFKKAEAEAEAKKAEAKKAEAEVKKAEAEAKKAEAEAKKAEAEKAEAETKKAEVKEDAKPAPSTMNQAPSTSPTK